MTKQDFIECFDEALELKKTKSSEWLAMVRYDVLRERMRLHLAELDFAQRFELGMAVLIFYGQGLNFPLINVLLSRR